MQCVSSYGFLQSTSSALRNNLTEPFFGEKSVCDHGFQGDFPTVIPLTARQSQIERRTSYQKSASYQVSCETSDSIGYIIVHNLVEEYVFENVYCENDSDQFGRPFGF